MTQRVARPPSIDRDFHAEYAGTCPICKDSYDVGTVIVKSVYGYQHAVCPGVEKVIKTTEAWERKTPGKHRHRFSRPQRAGIFDSTMVSRCTICGWKSTKYPKHN